MIQITVTNEKKMTVPQRKAAMPYELMADGSVIGVMQEKYTPGKAKTKCPNCKFEYDFTEPDGKPFYFTSRHP